MTEYHAPSYQVHLRAAGDQSARPAVTVVFRFASEQPAVGEPGPTPGDLQLLPGEAGGHRLTVSLGSAEKCTPERARRAGGALGRWLVDREIPEIAVDLDTIDGKFTQAALEGIRLGAYRFNRYKKNGAEHPEIAVVLLGAAATADLAARVEALTDAVLLARDLSHEPANVINPPSLAQRAQEIGQKAGLKVTVLDDQQLAAMGAGAILAVGRGSLTPPRMIILEYPGAGAPAGAKPVALVGKAITFDTGGYSIKNTENIVGMKYDKCGGVDVLAVMQAAAAMKVKTPLVGIICAAENMISGQAYRPDDILTTLSGKTVEIISTDAEGRLVLADGLAYAQQAFLPRAIIDLATLTGGVVTALGRVRAGLLSNNDALAGALFQSGEATFERLWRLPLDEEYSKAMKGEDADLKNSGGREGHCILGGAFLKEFVADDMPWAHLDIAGMADTNKELPYSPKGATGFGVRLLIHYLESL